jgi:hypothetical protein
MNKEQCEQYIIDAIKCSKNVLELGKQIYIHDVQIENSEEYDLVIVNAVGHMCENCYNKIKDVYESIIINGRSKYILINGESKLLRNIINKLNLWTLIFEVRGTANISHFVHNSIINNAL